jgi:hypothetical protein
VALIGDPNGGSRRACRFACHVAGRACRLLRLKTVDQTSKTGRPAKPGFLSLVALAAGSADLVTYAQETNPFLPKPGGIERKHAGFFVRARKPLRGHAAPAPVYRAAGIADAVSGDLRPLRA